MAIRLTTFRDRLAADLDQLERDLHALLDNSKIEYVNPNRRGGGVWFVGASDWGWSESDEAQLVARMNLDRAFTFWQERFTILGRGATHEIRKRADEAQNHLRDWIDRPKKYDYSIPRTIEEAKPVASGWIEELRWAVDVLSDQGASEVRVVPDTSALMRNPDVTAYASALGRNSYVVHFVPTVLGEIDNNKDQGRTPDARERAMTVSRRIKGLQDKGPLTQGVNVTRSISAKAEFRSPSFEHLPSWLRPEVPDDQILASILELQAQEPKSAVVLVASDMNIRNKAEMLGIPFIDTPDPDDE